MKTGDKVRVLRRGKGWTQEQLAEAIGYSKQYISEIERGNKDCYPLLKIGTGIGCQLSEAAGRLIH